MSDTTQCPCCNSTVRIEHGRLETVEMTKPDYPWKPGCHARMLEAMEEVCKIERVTMEELRSPARHRWLVECRFRAIVSARRRGASFSDIAAQLNRTPGSVEDLFRRPRPKAVA